MTSLARLKRGMGGSGAQKRARVHRLGLKIASPGRNSLRTWALAWRRSPIRGPRAIGDSLVGVAFVPNEAYHMNGGDPNPDGHLVKVVALASRGLGDGGIGHLISFETGSQQGLWVAGFGLIW